MLGHPRTTRATSTLRGPRTGVHGAPPTGVPATGERLAACSKPKPATYTHMRLIRRRHPTPDHSSRPGSSPRLTLATFSCSLIASALALAAFASARCSSFSLSKACHARGRRQDAIRAGAQDFVPRHARNTHTDASKGTRRAMQQQGLRPKKPPSSVDEASRTERHPTLHARERHCTLFAPCFPKPAPMFPHHAKILLESPHK